jgi:hypothetical protein
MQYFPPTHKSYIGQIKYSQARPFNNSDWSEGLEFQYFGDFGRPNSVPLVKTKGQSKTQKGQRIFEKTKKNKKPKIPTVLKRLT